MSFPSSPSNNQVVTVNNIVYTYASATNTWTRTPVANVTIGNTNTSTSTTTGALVVSGGTGIVGDIYAGGNITANTIGTTTTVANLVTTGGVYWSNGSAYSSGGSAAAGDTGQLQYNDTGVLGAAPFIYYSGNSVIVANATNTSTSTTTGALQLMGGAGIAGNLYVGSNIARNNRTVVTNFTGNTAPGTPLQGDEWFAANTGIMYKYLYDNISDTYNWVNITSSLYNANTAAVANTLALRDSGGNLTATNFIGIASSARYADLAEIYSSDKNYPPATVVVFGGTAEVTTTTKTHDTRVAGVVSTNPAYLMNSEATGVPVAFTGRVPCLVRGPVLKGDILVTSAHERYAERMDDRLYSPGCILGKSLGQVAENEFATIEVVVGRF